ncbi:FKBP-type peptidyl-prolyl cis-trans isomerase [Deinococcus planocerae]|uniref:FKBP-type peptidyl-prolyl cis-trans isomerase n=1 Tax=Deinococcus planocerae TaxID=1737569 RepID=UPI000C7F5548|nr:FKBP-type peptidyl-prolyl cis-trans isomerase [Deinococcus planocerae]
MNQQELIVEKYQEGNGTPASPGKTVRVHYTGTLPDGRKFDSSRDRGEPIEFPLGVGYVIPGWDQGIAQLRVGDRARLTIPPHLGYGAAGVPGVIPPNSTLVFDVELVDVR